jgi:hypothetical protein
MRRLQASEHPILWRLCGDWAQYYDLYHKEEPSKPFADMLLRSRKVNVQSADASRIGRTLTLQHQDRPPWKSCLFVS